MQFNFLSEKSKQNSRCNNSVIIIFEFRDTYATYFYVRYPYSLLFQTPQMNIGSRPCPIERNTRYPAVPLTARYPSRAIGKCHKAKRNRVINIRFWRRNSTDDPYGRQIVRQPETRPAALRNYMHRAHASVTSIDCVDRIYAVCAKVARGRRIPCYLMGFVTSWYFAHNMYVHEVYI